MYLLENKVAAATKEINRLVVGETDRRELWARVVAVVKPTADYYQREARLHVAAKLHNATIERERPCWKQLVQANAFLRVWFLEMQAATGFSALDVYCPALVNMPVRGADGKMDYVDVRCLNSKQDANGGHQLGLRNLLNSLSDEEFNMFIESTLTRHLQPLVAGISSEVAEGVSNLILWRYEKEDSMEADEVGRIYGDSAIRGKVLDAVERNAMNGRSGAKKLIEGELKSTIPLRGCLGALCRLVIGEYAKNYYFAKNAIAREQSQTEKEYVYHTAGESMLVQNKNGHRPGMASGRDNGYDTIAKLNNVQELNDTELGDFLGKVNSLWSPFARYMGEIPIAWDRAGNPTHYLNDKDIQTVMELRSESFGEWLRSENRIERRHDARVSEQFAAAEQVRHTVDMEQVIADMM